MKHADRAHRHPPKKSRQPCFVPPFDLRAGCSHHYNSWVGCRRNVLLRKVAGQGVRPMSKRTPEATGRVGHGLEIDPKYVEVVVTRWQSFTRKKAASGDGRTFDEIAQDRRREAE